MTRTTIGLNPMETCSPFFKFLNILSFPGFYYYKKDVNLFVTRNSIHDHHRRQNGLIEIPYYKLQKT